MPYTDQTEQPPRVLTADPDWWRGAVIYQIYPRSFQDSNSDGIGDLSGIIHRLPYVAQLGVDAIWISPFYRSPMLDFGYDVSDYRDVDPIFGSIGDFDALIARAHDLGLRVLIDLVLSHTAAQHPWFTESRASRTNSRADWYVWADPRPDGTPPNNWLSFFGGSAWQWDGERMQYYLHNFLPEQPDLNLHNPDVQEELLDVVRFWLERGVDGFRLDTVNYFFHDEKLRDNPALQRSERTETHAPAVNPYNFQDHVHDKNQSANLVFLQRIRALMEEFEDRTTLGEVGDGLHGAALQAEYTQGDDKLHMCYDFEFLSGHTPTGDYLADILQRTNQMMADGWACWAFSNHDVERHVTRWGLYDPSARIYAALLLSLRGSVCLYQGEELGLGEAYVAFEDLQDPYGKQFWPKYRGRDGARTPIPWVQDHQYGGFTDVKPWLPVAMEHLESAVSVQSDREDSMLAFYRHMIAFRRAHPCLVKGRLEIVSATPGAISFLRTHGDERLFCSFNLSPEPTDLILPPGDWQRDLGSPFILAPGEDETVLGPWQAAFALERV
ncbi:alpha-glucosidase [Chachezhania sediminis]|uniref:alpha-glucosidase n=1 Tax=Chachezhania sediminis TaxID=2599291 RepID=UPI001E4BFD93|nr:alpha-glucosidase [Chachezhania sediminis]